MNSGAKHIATWLIGPVLGISLVTFAVLGNTGPGFFYLTIAAAIGYVIIAPVAQAVLCRWPYFRMHRGQACAVALGAVTVLLLAISNARIFNQW